MDRSFACSLPPAGLRERRAVIDEIARAALRSRDPITGGARLTFTGGDDTERALRDLIAAESECCPFLRFDLERGDDEVRLDVTGPAEAQPMLAEMFA
jgi:alkanesulfonate monooxygenase SsuD/methylene tetrahydromethanopterin reductase-like flavin-dependent oxidoreductase (luciferase family)